MIAALITRNTHSEEQLEANFCLPSLPAVVHYMSKNFNDVTSSSRVSQVAIRRRPYSEDHLTLTPTEWYYPVTVLTLTLLLDS